MYLWGDDTGDRQSCKGSCRSNRLFGCTVEGGRSISNQRRLGNCRELGQECHAIRCKGLDQLLMWVSAGPRPRTVCGDGNRQRDNVVPHSFAGPVRVEWPKPEQRHRGQGSGCRIQICLCGGVVEELKVLIRIRKSALDLISPLGECWGGSSLVRKRASTVRYKTGRKHR